jgi:CRISPR-associated endonuclease Csn1
MDASYEVLWSLVPMTLLKVVDRNGTPFFPDQADSHVGYFRGLDRATGAIILSSIVNQTEMKTGIGARTLSHLQKLAVDRLGRIFDVRQEIRTWHGEACI